MSILSRYHRDIADNPVQRHERAHIQRERMSWFSRGLYAIAILTMIVLFLSGFTINFHETFSNCLTILGILNVVGVFAIEMHIIGSSAQSIRREFEGQTWNLLILTGVDTWRLILGKWVGVLRGNRRNIISLYVLHFITFLSGMALYNLQQDGFPRTCRRCEPSEFASLLDVRLDFSIIPTIAIIMAVYLMLEMMFVASLPIALSLFHRSRKSAVWLALGLRIAIPTAFVFLLTFIYYELPNGLGLAEQLQLNYNETFNLIIMRMTLIAGFITIDIQGLALSGFQVLLSIAGILFPLLWIWVMLRLANWAAHRHNVSNPGFIPKVKPKRPIFDTIVKTDTSPSSYQKPTHTAPKAIIYRCKVLRYNSARLDIAIYKQSETSPQQIIRFKDVSYFTGMTRWQTTNIAVQTNSDLETFANQYQVNSNRLPLGSKVYELQSSDTPIHIVATAMQKKELMHASKSSVY